MTTWPIFLLEIVINLLAGGSLLWMSAMILIPLWRAKKIRHPASTIGVLLGACSLHFIVEIGDLTFDRSLSSTLLGVADIAICAVLLFVSLLYLRWRLGSTRDLGFMLFEDETRRIQQAAEINDDVIQSLVATLMALDLGEVERARASLRSGLDSASRITNQLSQGPVLPGLLIRRRPARPPLPTTNP